MAHRPARLWSFAAAVALSLVLQPAASAPAGEGVFVPPNYAVATSIVGAYLVSGTEPGGAPEPAGKATITRVGSGEVYRLAEVVGTTNVEAICLRRDTLLGCGWSSGRPVGVAVYDLGSNGFEGTTLYPGATSPSVERLHGDPTALGDFKLQGVRPSGEAYDGIVTMIAGTAGVHRGIWSISGGFFAVGFGLRDGSSLVFGLNGEGSCGVVEYRIHPTGVLEGRWVDPLRGADVGTERLTRL